MSLPRQFRRFLLAGSIENETFEVSHQVRSRVGRVALGLLESGHGALQLVVHLERACLRR
jgi:hypothetical protein